MSHPFSRDTKLPKKRHPLYHRWTNLRGYVNNKTHPNYHLYGGKGIRLCYEWESNYLNFLLWAIKNGYKSGLVLSRLDKNKDFEPSNCIWAENSHSVEPVKI